VSRPTAAGAGTAGAPLLALRWAGTECATPLAGVLEVVRRRALASVPGAVAPLVGLLDLRGQAVAVLDLRGCHRGQRPPAAEHRPAAAPDTADPGRDVLVVRRPDGQLVGLLCDEVLGVSERGVHEPPGGLPGYVVAVQAGMVPIPVLDLERLLTALAPDFDPVPAQTETSAVQRADALWTTRTRR
jgi:chemotaxis signal transduction protein